MGYIPLHFTEEERIFRDQIYRFADQEIAPIADEIDQNDRFPEEIIPKFSELELLQWSVPASHGGPEGSLTMLCIAREAIARHSLSLSVLVGENGNILRHGWQDVLACIAQMFQFQVHYCQNMFS